MIEEKIASSIVWSGSGFFMIKPFRIDNLSKTSSLNQYKKFLLFGIRFLCTFAFGRTRSTSTAKAHRALISDGLYLAVFALLTKIATELLSVPIDGRPRRLASSKVVPQPTNGS